jgi:hypothetical protein
MDNEVWHIRAVEEFMARFNQQMNDEAFQRVHASNMSKLGAFLYSLQCGSFSLAFNSCQHSWQRLQRLQRRSQNNKSIPR